ncbi:hypothetical protein TQ38_003185 [Novosphingobium sp. P6W]|nr:hypothetical protein TQ38_003185 [Novosphingobium sp. P6W]KIS29714.1 hypothetical protein TQ38_26785 [Novosphingobium sp. P6W]
MPGADFAALLGITQAPVGKTVEPTLHTGGVVAAPLALLSDAVKDTQDGLAALALQAGAAAFPVAPKGATGVPIPVAVNPAAQPQISLQMPGNPALSATSPAASTFGFAAMPSRTEAPLTPGLEPVAANLAVTSPDAGSSIAAPSAPAVVGTVLKPGLPAGALSLPAESCAPIDGNGGKKTGKMLPHAIHTKHDDEAAAANETSLAAAPVAAVLAANLSLNAGLLFADLPNAEAARAQPVSAEQTLPTMPSATPMAVAPAAPRAAPSAAAPPASIVLPQANEVQLEPIELVAADSGRAASRETAAAPSVPIQPRPADPAPIASVRTAALDKPAPVATSAAAQPMRQSVEAAPVVQAQAALQRPEAAAPAPSADGAVQAAPAQPRTHASAKPARAEPVEPEGHSAPAAEIEAAPARTVLAMPQPGMADAAPVTPGTPSPDGDLTPSPTGETPQDFATLVSRLAEAREAASPNVVRTALSHAEFGRVSMQIGHEDGGLSVTLASRDPEFTGAVQAAAAAAANSAAGNGDQARPESQSQQQGSQPQTSANANANANASGGQNQQARTDASGQQARREGSAFGRPHDQQQPPAPPRGRSEQRPGSDIYA